MGALSELIRCRPRRRALRGARQRPARQAEPRRHGAVDDHGAAAAADRHLRPSARSRVGGRRHRAKWTGSPLQRPRAVHRLAAGEGRPLYDSAGRRAGGDRLGLCAQIQPRSSASLLIWRRGPRPVASARRIRLLPAGRRRAATQRTLCGGRLGSRPRGLLQRRPPPRHDARLTGWRAQPEGCFAVEGLDAIPRERRAMGVDPDGRKNRGPRRYARSTRTESYSSRSRHRSGRSPRGNRRILRSRAAANRNRRVRSVVEAALQLAPQLQGARRRTSRERRRPNIFGCAHGGAHSAGSAAAPAGCGSRPLRDRRSALPALQSHLRAMRRLRGRRGR